MSESNGNTGFMTCELKLDTRSPGWHKTMIKVLKNVSGVSYTIDAQAGIACVSGTVDPSTLLTLFAKAGKHAQLLRVHSGQHYHFSGVKPVVDTYNTHGNGYGTNYDRTQDRTLATTTAHHVHHYHRPPAPAPAEDSQCSIL